MCSAKRIPVQRAGHALIQEVSESLHAHHSTFQPLPITSFPTRHSTCAATVRHKTHEKNVHYNEQTSTLKLTPLQYHCKNSKHDTKKIINTITIRRDQSGRSRGGADPPPLSAVQLPPAEASL